MSLLFFYLEWTFYITHLIWFFWFILPSFGSTVREKCMGVWYCRRHIKSSVFEWYQIDQSDGQWSQLRNSMGLLLVFFSVTAIVNRILVRLPGFSHLGNFIRLVFGITFVFILHGLQGIIVISIAIVGFYLSRTFVWYSFSPLIAWLFGFSVLLLKESYRIRNRPGFQFVRLLFDNRYGGMYGWQFPTNFLVLRIISFSLDFHWFHNNLSSSKDNDDDRIPDNLITKENAHQNQSHHKLSEYSLVNYLAYVLYPQLYMAGPIISFNSFLANSNKVGPGYTTTKPDNIIFYGIRWIGCFAIMEYLTNNYACFAVVNSGLFPHLSVPELLITAYMTLKMMWLKFLLIWRFFRFFALVDGIHPPENMLRCMSNNFSLEGFWKGWHASFNKWIVQYLYVPIGGSKRKVFSVWIVFFFVALWHDIEWKLMLWALLNSIFFVIEIIGKRISRSAQILAMNGYLRNIVFVVSGASYIFVLVAVNMIGYAVGTGGGKIIAKKLLDYDGMLVVLCSFYFLCCAVVFMFSLRRMGLCAK